MHTPRHARGFVAMHRLAILWMIPLLGFPMLPVPELAGAIRYCDERGPWCSDHDPHEMIILWR